MAALSSRMIVKRDCLHRRGPVDSELHTTNRLTGIRANVRMTLSLPLPPPPYPLSCLSQTSQLARERARADNLAQELSQRKEIYLLCSAQLSGIARGSRSAWLGMRRKDIYLLCSACDTARQSDMRARSAIMASTRSKH